MDFRDGRGWHAAKTQLLLKNDKAGHVIEPLIVLGFMAPNDKLQQDRTYSIMGPFGQDYISSDCMIKHSLEIQTEVAAHLPKNLDNLAGKATLSGLCLVRNALFCNQTAGGWDLIINAEHNWYDPIREILVEFAVIYQFGLLTSAPSNWEGIEAGATMWLHGTVTGKDPVSNWVIVQVSVGLTSFLSLDGDYANFLSIWLGAQLLFGQSR
ncbi:hypothetical protein DFH28DRAFT_903697 [Melampsora americana]|nr:hypothetical protein DFH28DRAFT_903697 [Melampsora americana]